jgi:hypothetical protein
MRDATTALTPRRLVGELHERPRAHIRRRHREDERPRAERLAPVVAQVQVDVASHLSRERLAAFRRAVRLDERASTPAGVIQRHESVGDHDGPTQARNRLPIALPMQGDACSECCARELYCDVRERNSVIEHDNARATAYAPTRI